MSLKFTEEAMFSTEIDTEILNSLISNMIRFSLFYNDIFKKNVILKMMQIAKNSNLGQKRAVFCLFSYVKSVYSL